MAKVHYASILLALLGTPVAYARADDGIDWPLPAIANVVEHRNEYGKKSAEVQYALQLTPSQDGSRFRVRVLGLPKLIAGGKTQPESIAYIFMLTSLFPDLWVRRSDGETTIANLEENIDNYVEIMAAIYRDQKGWKKDLFTQRPFASMVISKVVARWDPWTTVATTQCPSMTVATKMPLPIGESESASGEAIARMRYQTWTAGDTTRGRCDVLMHALVNQAALDANLKTLDLPDEQGQDASSSSGSHMAIASRIDVETNTRRPVRIEVNESQVLEDSVEGPPSSKDTKLAYDIEWLPTATAKTFETPPKLDIHECKDAFRVTWQVQQKGKRADQDQTTNEITTCAEGMEVVTDEGGYTVERDDEDGSLAFRLKEGERSHRYRGRVPPDGKPHLLTGGDGLPSLIFTAEPLTLDQPFLWVNVTKTNAIEIVGYLIDEGIMSVRGLELLSPDRVDMHFDGIHATSLVTLLAFPTQVNVVYYRDRAYIEPIADDAEGEED